MQSKYSTLLLWGVLAVAFMAVVSCMRPKPEEMIVGTWKVDTIISEIFDQEQKELIEQALNVQKQVYFIVSDNGQMDIVSPVGARSANWVMDNDSLILKATFIDTKQESQIKFEEISEEVLILKEESKLGKFTTKYIKR